MHSLKLAICAIPTFTAAVGVVVLTIAIWSVAKIWLGLSP
jgi:hypothetical protein